MAEPEAEQAVSELHGGVIFRVMLGCLLGVGLGMNGVAMRGVCMVSRRLVIARFVMLRRLVVMLRCFLVMMCGLLVVVRALVIHRCRLLILPE